MKLGFLPQPRKIAVGRGYFILPPKGVIGIADHSLLPMARRAQQLFRHCSIQASAPPLKDTFAMRLNKSLKPGGYRLRVDPGGVFLEGATLEAVFHGWQTLCQAARQSPAGKLPLLRIDDWPDIPDRGVYYDVARGRVPKLEQLKQMAATLAEYKLNQLQLYIEHTFAFRGHADIGQGASPLTAEDILELDAYCRERYVDLVPSLASFGHLASVLKHPQYHRLAEDWGVGKYVTPDKSKQKWLKDWLAMTRQHAFTLSPANPQVYSFLDSLFAEFLPLFSSGRFNVCCDETVDLGYGQSYRLCNELGRGRVYLNHLLKLNELCRKYGKQMMFWGDIIRHHPELIPKIPKDVTVLDWGYEHNHNFEAIRDFKQAGLKFYACPSVASHSALFPRLPQANANIAGFAKAAGKYGGQGLLNTDWGDGGHYNFMEYSWHGYLFGAEQGWNTKADQASFTSRFCRLFLKSADAKLAAALDQLGEISHLHKNIWTQIFFAYAGHPVLASGPQGACAARNGRIRFERITLNAALGKRTLAQLAAIRAVFKAHARRRGEDPLKVLPYWIFAVDTLRHAARKLACYGQGARAGAGMRAGLRREIAALKIRFRALWLARNRPSEIRITMAKYHKARKAVLSLTAPGAAATGAQSKKLGARRPKVRAGQCPQGAAGDPLKVDWNKAARTGGWGTLIGWSTSRKVAARFAQDGEYLYIRLTEALDARTLSNDPDIFGGDDWEILFAAKRGQKPYRQIAINPKGARVELAYGEGPDKWASGAAVIAQASATEWAVSVALPMDRLLPGGVKPGQTIYANILRGGRDPLAWSPTFETGFHALERLGAIVFA